MQESRDEVTRITTGAQLQACDLELCITREAWAKLMGYCRATDMEVSGFMLLERDGDLLMVTDCFIPDQVSTGTSTEMDSTSIARLQMELFKRKLIGQPNQEDKVKLAHFHTHPTFNVFWSGTDMIMRETLRKGTDYYVSLVINQKGDALAAIDINGEFPMSISNLPVVLLDDQEIAKACALEVKAKVKSPKLTAWEGYDRMDNTYLPGLTGPKDAVIPLTARGEPDRRFRNVKAQTYAEWRAEREKEMRATVDADCRYIRDPADEVNDIIAEDGATWSDAQGTWQNIGGEIIKIEEAVDVGGNG